MPLRKKRTAPWTPNGAGRRFRSASGTEKYNPSARFAGTSFYTREVLAGRFTEPCCCLRSKRGSRGRAMRAPTGTAHHPAMWGPWTPPRMVNHPAQTPVQEEGVYGGTWFHSPPRMVRRGPRWNGLWSLHSWSSRRLARHWPRWQIAPGPAFARMKRRSFSPSPPSEEGKAMGLYKNGDTAVFLFHMKHFLAFPSAWV